MNQKGKICFYQKYYFDNKKEVKLYVLIRFLFGLEEKDHVLNEIENETARGIQPSQDLLTLMNIIR